MSIVNEAAAAKFRNAEAAEAQRRAEKEDRQGGTLRPSASLRSLRLIKKRENLRDDGSTRELPGDGFALQFNLGYAIRRSSPRKHPQSRLAVASVAAIRATPSALTIL